MDKEFLNNLKKELVFKCQLCGGQEWVGQKECPNNEVFSSAVELSNAGVPSAHILVRANDFQDFAKHPYHEVILKYGDMMKIAVNKGLGIILVGDYRTGKTYSIAYLLKRAFNFELKIKFTTALQLYKIHRLERNEGEEDIFEHHFFEKDVLAIDDLGKEINIAPDSWISFLDALLRYRVEHSKCTLITTNIASIADFTRTYGNSIRSILKHNFSLLVADNKEPIDNDGEEKWNELLKES